MVALDWKCTYVGAADSADYDQILEDVEFAPVHVGSNRFFFETPSPDPELVPREHLLGMTAVLLTGHYNDAEFVQVGYYVKNSMEDENTKLEEEPVRESPKISQDEGPLNFDRIVRQIFENSPKVTLYPIEWS